MVTAHVSVQVIKLVFTVSASVHNQCYLLKNTDYNSTGVESYDILSEML